MNDVLMSLVSGNTLEVSIQITDKAGSPVDITGATGIITIAEVRNPTSEQIIAQREVTLEAPETGLLFVELHPEDTQGYSGIFPFDIQLIFPDGDIKTPIAGYIEIFANVTNGASIVERHEQLVVESLINYYTKTEVDEKLAIAGGASIDDVTPSTTTVYSSQKVESELSSKAEAIHNHDGSYAPVGHTHTEYAPANHTHNEYAPTGHNHDGTYAPASHEHGTATDLPFTHVDFASTTTDVHLALIELMNRVKALEAELAGTSTSADTTTTSST